MNNEEIYLVMDEEPEEDFEEVLEKAQEEVQRILQTLEPSKLKEQY
jgi:hypothetical protein